MKSAAGPTTAAFGRNNSDWLDQVDYRLAETPEEKEEIYRLRYRAYLREGAIQPLSDQRVIDHFDDTPNAWTFGVYFHGQLYSSIRVSLLTPERRGSPPAALFCDGLPPPPGQGQVFVGFTRFAADPQKARKFPELSYLTGRLGSIC